MNADRDIEIKPSLSFTIKGKLFEVLLPEETEISPAVIKGFIELCTQIYQHKI